MNMTDDELIVLFDEVDNSGRWGHDDELGTLNHITDERRAAAAALVRSGHVVQMGLPISAASKPPAPPQFEHRISPASVGESAASADDYLAFAVHQQRFTHLDAVAHMPSYDGRSYNGRRFADVVRSDGVTHGSIFAQRRGIFARGVLLDLAAAAGRQWLQPGAGVTVEDLEHAEEYAGVRVSPGDVMVLRAGAEAYTAATGQPYVSAGPMPECIRWMHGREIAVYTGDSPERITPAAARLLGLPSAQSHPGEAEPTRFPLPMHQIAIPAMGLVLLDFCAVEELAQHCRTSQRCEFLFVASPLAIEGGTGCPVNPLAVF